MGILGAFLDRRLTHDLAERKVLVWYDPVRAWQPWVEAKLGLSSPLAQKLTLQEVELGEQETQVLAFGGSQYEVLQACEDLLAGHELPRVLLYLPGEPHLETLSPLREARVPRGRERALSEGPCSDLAAGVSIGRARRQQDR